MEESAKAELYTYAALLSSYYRNEAEFNKMINVITLQARFGVYCCMVLCILQSAVDILLVSVTSALIAFV